MTIQKMTTRSRDHPRVCGEKCGTHGLIAPVSGSPPRVRGKDASKALGEAGGGITPACAGKRGWTMVPESTSRDHPRVCGEKSPLSKESVLEWGSPPRVRGKGEVVSRCGIKARITPACAGKRATPSGFRRPRRDHPRVCGEKCLTSWQMVNPLGSPPRVRGKAEPLAVDGDITGITPACAGKRVFPGTHIPAVWDHPRVCGEKKGLCAADEPRQGSPPRVRGKGGVLTGRVGAQRITPACAGKSKPRRHGSPSAGDHPRVCGEKSYRSRYSGSRMGSPPRVRGKAGSSMASCS